MKIKSAEEKVIGILEKSSDGSTITELVGKLDLSRSTVRVALARLEGERKVSYRNIGMAKVYVIGGAR